MHARQQIDASRKHFERLFQRHIQDRSPLQLYSMFSCMTFYYKKGCDVELDTVHQIDLFLVSYIALASFDSWYYEFLMASDCRIHAQ